MMPLSLSALAQILCAELIGADDQIIGVATDSRKVTTGCLFIALKGEHCDAHDFAPAAVVAGAGALLVSKPLILDVPQLVVADTKLALGQLSSWVRQQAQIRIVAITGSSGKTSVKEMTAAILGECGDVLYTAGNFNNNIGVPLTLLRIQPQHDFAVIELGANHVSEIAYTSALTCPDSVLINNIGAAHLEGFGSLAGVYQAKAEIFIGLPDDGVAVINAQSNDWLHWKSMLYGKTVWRFSSQPIAGVEFFASKVCGSVTGMHFLLHSPFGCADISLPLPGIHNVANAVAAAALSMSVGASLTAVREGLKKVKAVPGRIFPIVLSENKLLLDDSYNSNVDSMTIAAQILATMPGYRVMVVSDIAELGTETQKLHRKVGESVRLAGLDKVISVGVLSQALSAASGNGEHCNNKESVIQRVVELLIEHKVITLLIKGSRCAAMEQVVYALQEKILC